MVADHKIKEKGVLQTMAYENFVPVIGIIQNISNGGECCTRRVSVRTDQGIINFMVTQETTIIESIRLERGMRIAAFYDSSLPVPLIFPPQYQAQLITTLGRNQNIMLNMFDGELTASDQSLKLNLGRRTEIMTLNGQPFTCNPGNHTLLVYYTATTRSIPPQTTPERIVVLCQ